MWSRHRRAIPGAPDDGREYWETLMRLATKIAEQESKAVQHETERREARLREIIREELERYGAR